MSRYTHPLVYLALPLQNRPETWFTAERDGYGHSLFGHTRRCRMPWKELQIMDQGLQFLSSYQKEELSEAEWSEFATAFDHRAL
jgi:hypothetical protein